ncbi:MAG: hypothetical protein M1837_000328 [Sclerophora amabilis]|nr:MAG: hypothetical protein M1837_000328 [Sclerophora amabilis]
MEISTETKAELIKGSALRFLLILPARLIDRANIQDAAQKMVDEAAAALLGAVGKSVETEQPSFLALNLDFKYAFIVFDLFFHDYCWESAHLITNNALPVHEMRWLRSGMVAVKRNKGLEGRVNADIARLHRCNGDDPAPFVEDRSPGADPVVYRNPRKL